MALDYVTLSLNISNYYDSLKTDTQQDNPEQVPYPKDPEDKWMNNYITAYDNDANGGVFTATSVVMISNPSLLLFDNTGSVCSGLNMMGARISAYWQAQLTHGVPQYNGIISVVNDAVKIQAPIDNYLCTLGEMVETTPYYEHLFDFIEQQVKTIIWTVTEVVGPSTTSYPVQIS